jgi:hypothetical protein
MYSLPQEIEVWYIIPAIRKEFARILTEKHSMTLEKAGNLIGVSKAAISQYLSNKRAGKFKLPKEIKKEIEKSANIIAKDEKKAIEEIERILDLIRKSRGSCSACKRYNPEILNLCRCKSCR